ncbi:hypothetical protein [Calothrix sp. NIES-3974]|nr:hypothetical protein [Calothrix sp. NIES-3974]
MCNFTLNWYKTISYSRLPIPTLTLQTFSATRLIKGYYQPFLTHQN